MALGTSLLCIMLVASVIAGIAAGIITGITPGVHVNLVSAILLSISPMIASYVPLIAIAACIVAMCVTHTFLDTIPSIFLGAPDDDKAMGVLPGHRYLLRGNGMMAVKLCVIGGIAGVLLSAMLFVPMIYAIGFAYAGAKGILFWLLIAIVLFTMLKDKRREWAVVVFITSGMLGMITLRLPLNEPLMPMLSGIFGVATLLYSINEEQGIPEQKVARHTDIDGRKAASGVARGFLAGAITALLPGISASSASAMTASGSKIGDHGFLILLGALGSASFVLSLAGFLAIEKARNGAIAVVVDIVSMDPGTTTILIGATLAAAGIAAIITLKLSEKAAAFLPRLPYQRMCIGVIAFVTMIVFLRCGAIGLLVLATSTAVGLLPAALKTARAQAMGCLLLPIIVMLA